MLKVILRENIEALGKIGDIVRVSEGYARNFLLPRNLALIADDKNTAAVEHHKKEMERKRQKTAKEAEDLASKLRKVACTISRKVGDQEKLFGSVTASDVAQVLATQGYKIDRKQIHLADPIKAVGVFSVSVKLHPDVTANVKVSVVAEK